MKNISIHLYKFDQDIYIFFGLKLFIEPVAALLFIKVVTSRNKERVGGKLYTLQ
jgi:hypothetical protein